MAFALKLIKISFVFVFQNDPQTPYLIHEKSMVKSADNFTICFRAQTTSIYTVSQMWVVQINVDQRKLKDLSQFWGAGSVTCTSVEVQEGLYMYSLKIFFASA